MKQILYFAGLILISHGCVNQSTVSTYPVVDRDSLVIYPDVTTARPVFGSPAVDADGREYVLLVLEDGHYSWIDATVENGEEFNYRQQFHGKGIQIKPDSIDFPYFAKYGIHSDKELSSCLSITGRSVSQITIDGRPRASSGVGFLTEDETILSVIRGDNKIVKKMGLTHPDIARPLFHIWNTNWLMGKLNSNQESLKIAYNGNEIKIITKGSRGWQESIFNDEILGSGHMYISSPMSTVDELFLDEEYANLTVDNLDSLKTMLTNIHTGEMVLFYITRYGFYEGRNEYKPDPLVVAYLFGLRSIEEIHKAAGGRLFTYLTKPHTENPVFKGTRHKAHGTGKDEDISNKQQVTSNKQQVTSNKQQVTHIPDPGSRIPHPETIDSLVSALAAAGRNWGEPSRKLIEIGEEAVPALLDLLMDKEEDQWPRRTAARTLNRIQSAQTVEPAIKLLFDKNDDLDVRNQIIPSLEGRDLSAYSEELWNLFQSSDNQWIKSNIANLLKTADTALAYNAFKKLYNTTDGFVQRHALSNLAMLRPHEATKWYLLGMQDDDWTVGNLCMDSLVNLNDLDVGLLIDLYSHDGISEETRWRLVHIFGRIDSSGKDFILRNAIEDTSWLIRMEALASLNSR